MPTKKEMVEELKTLGVEASVEEKTSELQTKLDKAKAPADGAAQGDGAGTTPTPPKEGEGTKPPEAPKKLAKTQPVLKGGVYHKGTHYDAGTVCPPDLVETFRDLGEIVDKVV